MAQSTDGIVLLAKQSGITSFSSLWQIKNALGTKKIGHTGTLDTFAEGLLVALAGKYTRLVPFFSDSDKEYLAENSLRRRDGPRWIPTEPPCQKPRYLNYKQSSNHYLHFRGVSCKNHRHSRRFTSMDSGHPISCGKAWQSIFFPAP